MNTNTPLYLDSLNGKKILITGGCGTVGKVLVDILTSSNCRPEQIIVVDNDEYKIFNFNLEFRHFDFINVFYVDVREFESLLEHCEDVDYLIHCAALKHVGICETQPEQAVLTNIVGVQNIISAAIKQNVKRVLFTSSDKAVNPTSVMGTTKLMGERLITAANNRKAKTIFSTTRFGNVIGSAGSVVEIFQNQLNQNKKLTVTDKRMTRFLMTIKDAGILILKSLFEMRGGEIFITKMGVANIEHLAKAMHQIHYQNSNNINNLEIEYIGHKIGEKLYEELMTDEERPRARETDNFFVVLPNFSGLYNQDTVEYYNESLKVTKTYNSQNETLLDQNSIIELLERMDTEKTEKHAQVSRTWPGDND